MTKYYDELIKNDLNIYFESITITIYFSEDKLKIKIIT